MKSVAVKSGRNFATCWRNLMPENLGQIYTETKAKGSFKTLVKFFQTAQPHMKEEGFLLYHIF